ncbi:MAG: hypothetical protein RIB53_09160 [Roseitalea porphyridii]|jgi:hypothetical protein|uniref:hypothetical protein n=1 Tax=Roseitalea porphyridii TaxID=1852022 RepID=UPI0032D96940
MNQQIWQIERHMWTGGVEAFQDHLADLCVMAFPAPIGLCFGQKVIDLVREAPRWNDVAMSEQTTVSPSQGVIVLAYRAEGRRDGDVYRAYCTSTYAEKQGAWKIVQHQQTPLN